MAPNSDDKTENTSDEAEKNDHNTQCPSPLWEGGGELNFCRGSKGGK